MFDIVHEVWSLMYMVRDILDLHSVGGQGVRSSEEFPGAAAHRLSVSLPKLASLPVNLLVEGLSKLPVRNFVQDICVGLATCVCQSV